jgi:hypothetical protein
MIATMILGFVLGSILAIVSQCSNYLRDIRRTARSSQVLQQRMEDLRLVTVYSNLQAQAGIAFSDPNDTNHIYAGRISESTYDSKGGTAIVTKVTLTVSWTNRTGRILTNTLTTLMSNGGLNKYIF